ncbi:MAG: hypothetical protein GX282_05955 [Campylobacteraceae bacterium]|nr:hypothetical protein [Campylobacteraceae bacterium]
MDIQNIELTEKTLEISLEGMSDDEVKKFKAEIYHALHVAFYQALNEQKKAKIKIYGGNDNNTLTDDEFKKLKERMQNIINQKKNREVLERLKNK